MLAEHKGRVASSVGVFTSAVFLSDFQGWGQQSFQEVGTVLADVLLCTRSSSLATGKMCALCPRAYLSRESVSLCVTQQLRGLTHLLHATVGKSVQQGGKVKLAI